MAKQAAVAEVVELKRPGLKDQFDEIDNEIRRFVSKRLYESRLRILIGMWRKGEAIAGEYNRLDSPVKVNYRQLERETERDWSN